jgi:hypothetical protein
LCKQVAEAFATVPYPGDRNIACRGWGCNPLAAHDLSEAVRGKHWKDLLQRGNKWFRENYDAFSILTPAAYHFYLPAFLIKTLTSVEDLDLVPSSITYSLGPPDPDRAGLVASYIARTSRFDSKQRLALCAFLRFLRDRLSPGDSERTYIARAEMALRRRRPRRKGAQGKHRT